MTIHRAVTHWFALDEARPLFAFAGLWRLWTGERKGEIGEHRLFAFLTTASNHVVRPIHAKAMPVLLTKPKEWDTWLHGSVNEAIALRSLPHKLLRIVATGEKSDEAPSIATLLGLTWVRRIMRKIVSGGQTGVDQAALRAAVACGLATGGWCPPGRISEDGTIPDIFQLKETPEERNQDALDIPKSQRTEWNVRDSDATLVLWPGTFDKLDPGTRYAIDCALRYKKYLLICDPTEQHQVNKAIDWIIRNNIETLNVSGPSEGTSPGVGALAERFIRGLLYAC